MHSVVLSSDWSRDMYPDNSVGKFTNLLHHNMNFSRENWSVALTDIAYTPDTWTSVRNGYNDIQIRMKGFNKWGLIPTTLWGGEALTFEVDGPKYRVTFGRRKGTTWDPNTPDTCTRPIYFRAEWMVGAPWELGDKQVNTPIFKKQNDRDNKWIFTPIKQWSKNDCNRFKLDILFTGPVIHDAWEYETAYVPTGFYASFKDFAIAFDVAINAAIKKIFVRNNAHPNTSGID